MKNSVYPAYSPNNCCGVREIKETNIPQVFECTYIRKTDIKKPILNDEAIPSKLDMRNVRANEEIHLSGFPYTH